jgi:cytochrome c556
MHTKWISRLALAGIVAAGLAGASLAQGMLSGDDAIVARKDIMRSNGAIMRTAANMTGADAITVGQTLHDNFTRAADLFPADSASGDTKALSAIWDNPDGFESALNAAIAASADILAAAEAGDTDAYTSALRTLGQACGSCHSTYRAL